MTIDYNVKLIQFPNNCVREAVTENDDGTFTIFISSALSKMEQRESFLHALEHILGDDFSKEDISTIERAAHNLEGTPELCFAG